MLELNWIAVFIAVLAYYLLGAAWFTPLFGRLWDRSIGHDRSATAGRFPTSYYVVPLLGAAVATAVTAVLVEATGTNGPIVGLSTGFGVGLVTAAASFTNSLTPHTPQPYVFAAVTGGYHLTALTAVGLILGAWQ